MTDRAVVVCAANTMELDSLLDLGEALGRSQLAREIILAVLVPPQDPALTETNALVQQRRAELVARDASVRAVVFTTPTPAEDIVRLTSREDVDLLLLRCPQIPESGALPPEVVAVLSNVACDVVLLSPLEEALEGSIVVPFGGLEHDWSALEIGAWISTAVGASLTLLGTQAGPDGTRDASRLLGDASLLVQRYLGISADLRLVDLASDALHREAAEAALLVLGLPDRWRQEGVGPLRASLVRASHSPVLLVRKGTRPGGLAPRETVTTFAWSLVDTAASGGLFSAPC
jgi:hypothetical protein